MVRPTLIHLNPLEPKYYPFMISLAKCAGSSYPQKYMSEENKKT